jgi:Cu/Ag efflux protein CusF
MHTPHLLALALAAVAGLATPAWSQPKAADHAAHHSADAAALTDGEVRKIDAAGAKLTIQHGEIKNLDMPPMTMVFNVKDKAMLEGVKPGDKIRFKAVKDSGKYTVTEMQVVR